MLQPIEIRTNTNRSNHNRRVALLYEELGALEIAEDNGILKVWYPFGRQISYREEVVPHTGESEPILNSARKVACHYYRSANLLEVKKGEYYIHIQFPPGELEFDTDGQALS